LRNSATVIRIGTFANASIDPVIAWIGPEIPSGVLRSVRRRREGRPNLGKADPIYTPAGRAAGGSVSSRATGRQEGMPDDTHIDLSQRVAALEQMLVESTAVAL
jgi:hypothetical protein